MSSDIQLIDMNKIKIDGGTQHRNVDSKVRDEYAELLREGSDFPPVDVVFDGKRYWLWDGFHRYQAHIAAESDNIMANVTEGTKRDAVWLSFGANKNHGVRRKPEDVRKILAVIHGDKAFRAKMTYHLIAEHVGVSESTVKRVFDELDSIPLETGQRAVISNDESENTDSDGPETAEDETGDLPRETSPTLTTRDAKPMKDGAGNDIPRKLVDIFLKGKEIQSLSRTLSTIENEIINLHSTHNPAMRHFPFDRFKVDIENARNDIRCAEPYAVCPYCGGEAKGCKACKGAGWITKGMYENAPRELK